MFYTEQLTCLNLADCITIDERYESTVSGEKRCYENYPDKDFSKVRETF